MSLTDRVEYRYLFDLIDRYMQRFDPDTDLCRQLNDCVQAAHRLHQADKAAHMTASPGETALIGQLLAAMHQGNLLSAELYPELVSIEKDIFEFFCPLFGQHHGQMSHGGTYSNIEVLWRARKNSRGRSIRVYASDQAHYSIAKACDMLGLELHLIPTDGMQQMNISALARACEQNQPMAVIATAGTTSSGQIDDIPAIKKVLGTCPGWLHVDAAWGGFLTFIENSPLTAEVLGLADSVCFDPHKSLGQPRPCGLLLYQQQGQPETMSADYLMQAPRMTLAGSYGGELLLPLWLSIKILGREGFARQLSVQLEQARQFAEYIQNQPGCWSQCSPTGIVIFTVPATVDLLPLIEQGLFSLCKIQDEQVYRAVFANTATLSTALIKAVAPYL